MKYTFAKIHFCKNTLLKCTFEKILLCYGQVGPRQEELIQRINYTRYTLEKQLLQIHLCKNTLLKNTLCSFEKYYYVMVRLALVRRSWSRGWTMAATRQTQSTPSHPLLAQTGVFSYLSVCICVFVYFHICVFVFAYLCIWVVIFIITIIIMVDSLNHFWAFHYSEAAFDTSSRIIFHTPAFTLPSKSEILRTRKIKFGTLFWK